MKEYKEFLSEKVKKHIPSGFDVEKLNSHLFDFQKFIVKKSLKKGRYAIFADTGLGKTIMQLEWAHQVIKHTGKPVLILAPLAVSGQTINEGKKFGIEVTRYIEEIKNDCIYITNYEQLHKIDVEPFAGIVLDESSILKNYTGVYKNMIIDKFKNTPYKVACTATPSPNDYNEIGNHSEFLDILEAPDMRSRWFVRDEGMNNYRLKKHGHADFFSWINSWCTFVCKPSDLGFNDEGFDLPGLQYNDHMITTEKRDNGKLFNDVSVNATNFNRELRESQPERLAKVVEILEEDRTKTFIVWVNQNAEADQLNKDLQNLGYEKGSDFVEVRGSEKTEVKEEKLLGFANGKYRVLITKTKIAQFGMNFQVCNNQIFSALDFSFESLYQAIRRSFRFGQKEIVTINLITVDTMQNVIATILKKETQFNAMKAEMNKEINNINHGLVMDYEKEEVKTDHYHLIKGDTVQEIDAIKDASIDFSVFSPPFSTLFTYSNNICDMGNCESNEQFFEQTDFLLSKLFAKMKPGSIVCVHSKDLARYKGSSGYTGLYDFTGDYHRAMEKAGFKYHSKVTIWTDPVLEMQRTKTQRLLYKQLRKDSKLSGVGLPEYLTIFRKWEGVELFEDYKQVNNKTFDNFPLDTWQNWASSVWGEKLNKKDLIDLISMYYENNSVDLNEETKMLNPKLFVGSWFDIRRTDVLNGKEGTAQGDEKHIAPLQLTVIDRAIKMWSMPGDVVFTPFLGIGSEAYTAIKNRRFAIGIELKDSYFNVAVRNCQNAVSKQNQIEMFT